MKMGEGFGDEGFPPRDWRYDTSIVGTAWVGIA
jgi:hypothetical protein